MWRRLSNLSVRQKVFLGTAAGAAGAGVYYAGTKLYEMYIETSREVEEYVEKKQAHEEITLKHRTETNVVTHFESVQNIADSTTMPSILPHLEESLFALVNLTELTDQLMYSRTSEESPITQKQKYAIWNELKVLSVTQSFSAAVGISLLEVFVRVQLNIVGRYLYLDSAFDVTKKDMPSTLSKSCQHTFLEYANFLPQKGLASVVEKVRGCAEEVLNRITLKSEMDFATLCELLVELQVSYLQAVSDEGWESILLPPVGSEFPHPSRQGEGADASAALASSSSVQSDKNTSDAQADQDGVRLAVLLGETRAVIRGPEFRSVIADAIKVAVASLQEAMQAIYPDPDLPIPMPKLIPRLAAFSKVVFQHDEGHNIVAQAIVQLPSLDSLCANLYSSPPSFPP